MKFLWATHLVALCATKEAAYTHIRKWVEANGLKLHPEKTHIGNCQVEGQGFEFLGYRFEEGRRYVRKKSLMNLRDSIREKTKRSCGRSVVTVIKSVNPILRGWFSYFKHAYKSVFRDIDGFVRRRLRAILRRQKHKPGRGHCYKDHKMWPNTYFANLGLFTMHEAHTLACQSRCGNN